MEAFLVPRAGSGALMVGVGFGGCGTGDWGERWGRQRAAVTGASKKQLAVPLGRRCDGFPHSFLLFFRLQVVIIDLPTGRERANSVWQLGLHQV